MTNGALTGLLEDSERHCVSQQASNVGFGQATARSHFGESCFILAGWEGGSEPESDDGLPADPRVELSLGMSMHAAERTQSMADILTGCPVIMSTGPCIRA